MRRLRLLLGLSLPCHAERRPTPAMSRPAGCPRCGAPIEVNAQLEYECCSAGGPAHYWRWRSHA